MERITAVHRGIVAAVVRTRGEATYRYRGKGGSVNRIRVTNARVCCTPSPRHPSRSARKRWMQLAVILQSVQTPFRCVRRESDPTQSCNLSTELRYTYIFYRPLRCRCAQGDVVERDNILTRRDRPPSKGGKGPSHSPRQGIRPTQIRVHVCFDVTIWKRSRRSFAQYHYALRCMSNITRLSALGKFSRRSLTIRTYMKVATSLHPICIYLNNAECDSGDKAQHIIDRVFYQLR